MRSGPTRKAPRKTPATIDEYIRGFPPDVRAILRRIRSTIRRAAPNAEETISYGIPAFQQNRTLVYFAAFQKHVGLYPPVSSDEALKKALAPYAGEKGNLRFSLDRPIPYGLIGRIVRLRVKQDSARPASGRRRTARKERSA
jgi:uncharacterized protein YdhG (YjbR/CyaY superfamily)